MTVYQVIVVTLVIFVMLVVVSRIERQQKKDREKLDRLHAIFLLHMQEEHGTPIPDRNRTLLLKKIPMDEDTITGEIVKNWEDRRGRGDGKAETAFTS
jgi:hypothetical protein